MSWGLLGASWGRFGGQHGSNLAPKTEPKSIKIDAKINKFVKASWDLIFIGFWLTLEGKWRQVGIRMASKIDANFERPFFQKTLFCRGENNDFEGSGNRSWEPKSIKIRSKKHVNMRRHLGIDVSSILMDFGSQVGPKLAPKTQQKWIWKTLKK